MVGELYVEVVCGAIFEGSSVMILFDTQICFFVAVFYLITQLLGPCVFLGRLAAMTRRSSLHQSRDPPQFFSLYSAMPSPKGLNRIRNLDKHGRRYAHKRSRQNVDLLGLGTVCDDHHSFCPFLNSFRKLPLSFLEGAPMI